MARLELDVVVRGLDQVESEFQDAEVAARGLSEQVEVISSSASFTHLASNMELAQHALIELVANMRDMDNLMDKINREGFDEAAREAQTFLQLERDLNAELQKQVRLKAKLAAEGLGEGQHADSGLAQQLRAQKEITKELEDQVNAEKRAEAIKKKLHKEGKARAAEMLRVVKAAQKARVRARTAALREIRRKEEREAREEKQRLKDLAAYRRKLLGGVGSALGLGFAAGGAAGVAIAGINALVRGVTALARAWFDMNRMAVTSFLQINTQMEQMKILLNTATGSAEAGREAFDDMLTFATEAPFTIDSLADSFVKLKTAGLDPMDGTLQTLVDSVAAFGGTSENLRLVSVAVQQMVGKGVISMEELRRQFGEQVPTAMRAMAEGLGMNILDMFDLISEGGLETKRGLEAMLGVLDEWHGGAAKDRMESMQGALANLRNAWIELMLSIGDSNSVFGELKSAVNVIADAIRAFKDSEEAKAQIGALTQVVVDFVNTIKNDPTIVSDFFLLMIDTMKLAIRIALELFKVIAKGLDALVNEKVEFGFVDSMLAVLKLTPGGPAASQFVSMYERLHGESPEESKSTLTSTINDLESQFNNFENKLGDAKVKIPPADVDSTLSSLEQVEAALAADAANWETYAQQAVDAMVKIQAEIKELKQTMDDTFKDMENEEFDIALGFVDDNAAKNEAIMKRIAEVQAEYQAGVQGSNTDWEAQIENLKEIRELIKKLETDVAAVSKEQVAAAKAQYEYLHKATRGGKVAGMGDEYKEAKEEYFRLYKLQKEGKKDVQAEKDLQNEKLRLLKENRQQIQDIYQTQIDALNKQKEKEQENLDFWNKAIKDKKYHLGQWADTRDKAYEAWRQDNLDMINQINQIKEGYDSIEFPSGGSGSPEYKMAGGPVSAGSPYIVGEAGPELFVPGRSGTIVPNDQLGTTDEVSVAFNFNGRNAGSLRGSRQAADQILEEFARMQGAMS